MSIPSDPGQPFITSAPVSVRERKSHTKSRGGCCECKRRKQKCREQKPICSRCVERETICVYIDVRSVQARTKETIRQGFVSSSSSSSASPSAIEPIVHQLGQFDVQDMALWHHYIKETSIVTSVVFGGKPELGLTCDFLLHGMLATAAIHLARLQPDNRQKYNLLARQHQDLALGPFRQAMASIGADNIDNLYFYSVLLVVCSLASSETLHIDGSSGPSSGIADWMICCRGAMAVANAFPSHVGGFPVGQWLAHIREMPFVEGVSVNMSPEEQESFNRIEGLLATSQVSIGSPDIEETAAYLHALEKLRHTFSFTVDSFDYVLIVTIKKFSSTPIPQKLSRRLFLTLWPFSVTELFVKLLSDMHPPALIIMAHFCLILRKSKDCWYMAESGLRILQAIQKSLGSEWSRYNEYPRRVFGL